MFNQLEFLKSFMLNINIIITHQNIQILFSIIGIILGAFMTINLIIHKYQHNKFTLIQCISVCSSSIFVFSFIGGCLGHFINIYYLIITILYALIK